MPLLLLTNFFHLGATVYGTAPTVYGFLILQNSSGYINLQFPIA